MAAGGEGEKMRQKKKKSKVGKTPAGQENKCRGSGISYHHHHGFDDVQLCLVGSVSVQAWRPWQGQSPAARQRGGEQEQRGACAALL